MAEAAESKEKRARGKMKNVVAIMALGIASVSFAEGQLIGADEADCTKAKTYSIRQQCEAAKAKENELHPKISREPKNEQITQSQNVIASSRPDNSKNINTGDMNKYKAQAMIKAIRDETSDCRIKFDVYWASNREKVKPCLQRMMDTLQEGGDFEKAHTYLASLKEGELSVAEMKQAIYYIQEIAKDKEYIVYRIQR